jgi:hypothetical protein
MWKLGLRPRNSQVRDGMGAMAEWSSIPLGGLCSCLGTTAIQYSSSWMTEAAAEHTLLENPFLYTEKTLFCKFGTNILRNETARPHSQFPFNVSVSDLYIPTIGLHILLQENRWTDRGNI